MVVYADILVLLNIIVDYFLLKLTARFLNISPPVIRLILGSVAGGIFSLYIFLPQSPALAELVVRFVFCLILSLIAFGFGSAKRFLRNAAVLFAVTFCYAGAMIALWYIFKPSGMVINNSVVYFNISPAILIAFSVFFYFAAIILRRILERNCKTAKQCKVTIFADNSNLELTAIVDTGNSLTDAFGMSEVIITDKDHIDGLLKEFELKGDIAMRYRILPCNTVAGGTMLDGYRCDKAVIEHGKHKTEISRPILAVSKTALGGEYDAIINPRSL